MLQESPIQIDPASWRSWKRDLVTQEVYRVLGKELEIWVSQILEGQTMERTGDEVKDTAGAIGWVQALKLFLYGLDEELREQWQEAEEEAEREKGRK